MINSITKKDLMSCIYNVKNAGDKDRSNGFYSEASVMVLFTNNEKKNDNLKKFVLEHYTWESIADETIRCYERVLKS